jgi:hypothetical protein
MAHILGWADRGDKAGSSRRTVVKPKHTRMPGRQHLRPRRVTRASNPIKQCGASFRVGISAAMGAVLASAAVMLAPWTQAMPYGNYTLNIDGRYDFHTWVWMVSPCQASCLLVAARAQPVAKAYLYTGKAQLNDGQYTLAIDDPLGLRCDNVYYGPTIPTHDVYVWDAGTLAGSMQSSSDAGCDGAPGGTLNYPFRLARM